MIDSLLNDGYYVSVLSDYDYKKQINGLEKQVKGKSKYEDYSLVEYLPRNKEFFVICDEINCYDVVEEWDFRIITLYKGIPFILIDSGSN